MNTVILTLTIIGGLAFFPLLKLASVTPPGRSRTIIFAVLLLIGAATLKSCQHDAVGISKVVVPASQGAGTTIDSLQQDLGAELEG